MSYGGGSSRYLEADVLSRQKEWLVPLMYDHLLSSLRRAAAQIEAGDLEGKAASLDKASGIVLELIATLDFERGGELASRLSALYAYFANEIITIGRTLDVAHLNRLIEMVAGLHDAWARAAESIAPRSRTGAPAPGGMPVA
jgi:flagellar secretion chaperone FliS